MTSRPATASERDAVARCLTAGFATDPVWELALRRDDGRIDHHLPYWTLFVDGAMRYGTARVTDNLEAVSIWLPPGGTELSAEGVDDLEALLGTSLAPADVVAIHTLIDRFEASRAPLTEHYYLSLLATDPAHRGRGVGQVLLAESLAEWDRAGVPAYLESTNAANDHRYARAGFQPIGGFKAVRDDTWITAMWRPTGAATADQAVTPPGA